MRTLWTRLRGFLFARRLDRDLERQIESHIALHVEDLVRGGMSPQEARRQAAREFGNATSIREVYRETRSLPLLETLLLDVRYAARTLLRRPGFTALALAALSLSIGLSTALFSIVHGVLLRSLPYPDQDRLMTVWQTDPKKGGARDEVAIGNFLDWRLRQRSFEGLAIAEPFSHELSGDGEPEAIRSWIVSEGFFEVMGTPPLLGRWFTAEDYRAGSPLEGYYPGAARVVIISHGLWQRRFGGDPNLIGKQLQLRGRPMTIVGVMPPEFQFPAKRELWSPRLPQPQDRDSRAATYMTVTGRLKPGITREQARQDMARIAAELEAEHPRTNQGVGVRLIPIADYLTDGVRPVLWILFGAASLLLVAACANVGGLLLARGVERRHELAVRSAIGGSTRRLVRQLLTETGLLALAGGLGGVAIAYGALRLLMFLPPSQVPRIEYVGLSGAVLLFCCAVTALTALACGLAPALRMVRVDLADALKSSSRALAAAPARQRGRQVLVAAQVALAMVLLTGAALLARSLATLLAVDPGFRPERILSLEVHVYARARTPQERIAYFRQTLDRLSRTPGVVSAAAVSAFPFHDNAIDIETAVQVVGAPELPVHQRPTARITTATPAYFELMRIPLRDGRTFGDADALETERVAIVNEAMARRFFDARGALGQRVVTGTGGAPRTIVGVVGNTLRKGLSEPPQPELYVPHAQSGTGSMTCVVRTAADPWGLVPAIKEAIWSVKGGQPFSKIATAEQLMSTTHSERRFHLALIALFAGMAVMLATVGLFGLVSYAANQRRGEMGLRMALGASGLNVLGLVVREALSLAGLGVALGLVGALVAGNLIRAMLFGVTPYDPASLAGAPALLLLIAIAASAAPALRAARVDLMRALRAE
ncbi:MAG: ABC transporter permease [Bryobacteraceae bacterium]|nr:ABC transporter permease [Bryobacteraceae bacterium]